MKLSLLVGVVTLSLSSVSLANTEKFRITGGGGYTFNNGISSSEMQSSLAEQGFNSEISSFDNKSLGYSVWLGWQAHKNILLEAGYIDFGKTTVKAIEKNSKPNFEKAITESMPTSGSGYSLAIRPTYYFDDDWSLYGRVGILQWSSDLRAANYHNEKSGTDLLIGSGVEYRINENFATSLSWDAAKLDNTQNHLVSLNVSYLFGFNKKQVLSKKNTGVVSPISVTSQEGNSSNLNAERARSIDATEEVKEVSFFFEHDRYSPKMVETTKVLNLLEQIEAGNKISIQASTDYSGPSVYNIKLAKKRAEFVAKYLHEKGISYQNMTFDILGEVDGKPKEKYRRVIITLSK
ncbi:OmpA family protein [Photobacterium sanguinicancri]|uniref:OmpA family protein n=1 Tax=Photobacterium sanguinicancri TaxID=875932 RepID=UPI0026E375BB|nr:outer membrane beta-barrel protein [Photobacterium sanguinicancri]MDO6500938.1 outer membrane beta-barrel protein [Photobacterium sanguinicancri]